MIGSLKGAVLAKNKNPILLDVHDVGYTVHVTETLRVALKPNQELFLFIHSHIREDAFDLFGFLTEKELAYFELLLTVSGIGPKTALCIIERGVEQIQKAITSSDVDFFTVIPRLGKKNAQKIIIELKSKFGDGSMLDLSSDDSDTKEFMDALLAMGFQKKEIVDTIKTIPNDTHTSKDKIKYCLTRLGKRI